MKSAKSSNHTYSSTNDSIDIWFAEISDDSIEIENQTEALLSESEKARLRATANPHKRREFLLSRALMRHALTQRFGPAEGFWNFQYQSNHAPEITNLPRPVYTGLSHSKGLTGFVISNTPVGLDLEMLNSRRNIGGIAEITMTRDEVHYLDQHPEEKEKRFYELWCCKEAYYKTLAPLDQSGIQFSNLSVDQINKGNSAWHFLLNNIGEYIVAVATVAWPVVIRHRVFQTGFNSRLQIKLQELTDSYYRPGQKENT